MKQEPDNPAVFNQPDVSENQPLAKNPAGYGYVHRITDIAIQSGNNQMTGWEDRRRGAQALQGKSHKRIQKANRPKRDENNPNPANERHPEEWSFDPPVRDPPGRHAGDEPGGDDQEDRGTGYGEDLSHQVQMYSNFAASDSAVAARVPNVT